MNGAEGIAYRSRITPESSTNLAFLDHATLSGSSVPLRACSDLLDRLIIRRGFIIDFDF